jgi:hypothetical protein
MPAIGRAPGRCKDKGAEGPRSGPWSEAQGMSVSETMAAPGSRPQAGNGPSGFAPLHPQEPGAVDPEQAGEHKARLL